MLEEATLWSEIPLTSRSARHRLGDGGLLDQLREVLDHLRFDVGAARRMRYKAPPSYSPGARPVSPACRYAARTCCSLRALLAAVQGTAVADGVAAAVVEVATAGQFPSDGQLTSVSPLLGKNFIYPFWNSWR